MRRWWTAAVCVLATASWAPDAARADVLRLKNGNVLRGEIVAESPTELKFSVNGGVLTIPRTQVAELVREARAKRGSTGPAPLDVSDSTIRKLVLEGRARLAAERLARAAQRSSASLSRLGGRTAQTWVITGNASYRARRFGEAAHAYLQALSFQPAWDRALERRFFDASLADIRTRLLEEGEYEEARAKVAELRDGLPDDPVAAWLDGRVAEAMEQPARARAAYADAVGGAKADESLADLRTRATAAAATGTPAGGVVDWSAAPLAEAERAEMSGFVVEHRNPAAARRLARAVSWHLRAQEARLGRHARRFAPSASIVIRLHSKAGGMEGTAEAWAAGLAHSRFKGGTLQREEIDLMQDSAQLLGSALPHEIGHLMLARAIGPHRSFPHALAEGFATQFEAPWKRLWYRRVVRAARGGDRMSSVSLLRARSYPPAEKVAVFYAGSFCLVEALLERGGMGRLVRFCERAGQGDPLDALMDMYELAPDELDGMIDRRLKR